MARERKRYAGARLAEIRRGLGLTQAAFARGLGVSPSYLNQMERNHRPLSRAAAAGLRGAYGIDAAIFGVDATDRLAADIGEALADPVFAGEPPGAAEVEIVAANAPALARAFLDLHSAHRAANERLAALDAQLGQDEEDRAAASPWEEVRDFFHYCDNHIDPIDRAAETFAERIGLGGGGGRDRRDAAEALASWLSETRGVTVAIEGGDLRRYHAGLRRLAISAQASGPTRAFQLAHQIALLDQGELIDAVLDLANFRTEEARSICRIGLANYFAGAVLMPYGAFLAAADRARHDIERLADMFGASFEQIGHRLSTLQRSGAKGVPFFFVRVDQAGTITKRHSATRLQFARYGGACPLWNVHSAFETPGRFLRQLAETPDGVRYLCLARDVSHSGGAFRAPVRRYAIGLGCEIAYADRLVYADDLDAGADAAYEQIGVSCRICPRAACHQRSVPPLQRPVIVDPSVRGALPYALGER